MIRDPFLCWSTVGRSIWPRKSCAISSMMNGSRNPFLADIVETLREFPLCRKIILFLIENESAMDNALGIATCWVDSDEVAVQAALDRLIRCGAVNSYTFSSGTLYGLTRNQSARAWLRTALSVDHNSNSQFIRHTNNPTR